MARKVTIDDLAKKLDISRNTVSRALNGSHLVSEQTKEKVLETAQEMGYGINPLLISSPSEPDEANDVKIAYITRLDVNTTYFFSSILNAIENHITKLGGSLVFIVVRQSDIISRKVPPAILRCDGLICADIFDKDYQESLLNTGVPAVMIDSNWDPFRFNVPHATIMMENDRNVEILTDGLFSRGHTKIAFVGDPKYCRGFYERYRGYVTSHFNHGLLPSSSILFSKETLDTDILIEMLRNTEATAFVCANDFHAISVVKALQHLSVQVPQQAEVVGFDDLPESEIIQPMLTTVHTFTSQIGRRAAATIWERIKNPSVPNETIYLPTVIKYRDSTR